MIAVIVPVLGRPHRAQPLVDSVVLASKHVDRVVFVVSPGDDEQRAACVATGCPVFIAPFEPGPGDYAKKINLGVAQTPEPWVFTGADDLMFYDGWDVHALDAASDGVRVVATNDLWNPAVLRGKHGTHSLVARSYIEDPGAVVGQPGHVYFEGYDHQCCDNELTETAQRRGVWAYSKASRVEHLHPMAHKAPMDATYEKGLAHGRDDIRLFQSRRRLWVQERR